MSHPSTSGSSGDSPRSASKKEKVSNSFDRSRLSELDLRGVGIDEGVDADDLVSVGEEGLRSDGTR